MSENFNEPRLSDLEESLRSLKPASRQIDPFQLAYEAGRASSSRGWFWPSLSVVASAASLVLGILLWQSADSPTIREVVVVVKEQPNAPTPKAPSAPTKEPKKENRSLVRLSTPFTQTMQLKSGYLQRRDLVMRLGIDALPSPRPTAQQSVSPLRYSDVYLTTDEGDPSAPIHSPTDFPWSFQ